MKSQRDLNSTNGGNKGGKVMKIVLNKCFGGFGLSHEAKMEIFKRKNIEVFPYINNFSYDSDDEYTRHTGQKLGSMDFIYYFKKDPKIDKVTGIYSEIDRLYGIADDSSFSSDSNRGDKDLVAVVEKLGSEASGPYASLKVVDIPDGAEWEISDYDGVETAHYGFQTGSI